MSSNRFDNTYKKYLKENILSGIAGGMTDFAGGFKKGIEKAQEGRPFWVDNPKNEKEKELKNIKSIGFQNKPKKGELIKYPLRNNLYITGKVLTNINQKGQWEIEIVNDKNSADPLYYYISDIYTDGIITTPSYMKQKHKTQDELDSIEQYKDAVVGLNTPYPKWYRETDIKKSF